MGLTFKENCPDPRNSKVSDIIKHLISNRFEVKIYDPLLKSNENIKIPFKNFFSDPFKKRNYFDLIVIAVPHDFFLKIGIKKIKQLGKKELLIYDLKGAFPKKSTNWRL